MFFNNVMSTKLLQANVGQDEDFEAAEKKAIALGAQKVSASVSIFLKGFFKKQIFEIAFMFVV